MYCFWAGGRYGAVAAGLAGGGGGGGGGGALEPREELATAGMATWSCEPGPTPCGTVTCTCPPDGAATSSCMPGYTPGGTATSITCCACAAGAAGAAGAADAAGSSKVGLTAGGGPEVARLATRPAADAS